jgi:DNA-binding CsgD family transcriptional regulator
MQEMDEVSTIIGLIYEASYDSSSWPIALENITRYTHSYSAALIYQDINPQRMGDLYTYNISAETSAEYKAYGIDPNFQIALDNVPLGKAVAIDHIITDRNKLEDIYGEKFNKLLKDAGIYHLGGAILFFDDSRVSAISLQRKKSMGVWKKSQIDKLNILIPHIRRAINIQKKFERLKNREQALHKGLDKLLMGLILFDKELHPIYINPVARSILKKHPAINLKNNKISTHKRSQTEKIKAALAAAVSPGQDSATESTSTSLGLKHPACATTLPVIISHVHGILHGFETEGSHAHAVMCFSDPCAAYPIEADKLADIYELTPAESQVAIAIANGISTDQIAIMNNVAISTVRSQLKSIYHKLGVNSQAGLVKVLLTGPFSQNL